MARSDPLASITFSVRVEEEEVAIFIHNTSFTGLGHAFRLSVTPQPVCATGVSCSRPSRSCSAIRYSALPGKGLLSAKAYLRSSVLVPDAGTLPMVVHPAPSALLSIV